MQYILHNTIYNKISLYSYSIQVQISLKEIRPLSLPWVCCSWILQHSSNFRWDQRCFLGGSIVYTNSAVLRYCLYFFLLLLTFLFIYRWAFNYLGSVLCYFGHLNLYRYDAHFLLDSKIYIYKYIKLPRKKQVPGVQVVTVCSRPTVLLPLGYLAPIFFL